MGKIIRQFAIHNVHSNYHVYILLIMYTSQCMYCTMVKNLLIVREIMKQVLQSTVSTWRLNTRVFFRGIKKSERTSKISFLISEQVSHIQKLLAKKGRPQLKLWKFVYQ